MFKLLAEQTVSVGSDSVHIYSTLGESVVYKPLRNDTSSLEPCAHEEADTRISIYVKDAVNENLSNFLIRTADTDVVVLAVSFLNQFNGIELHFAFGTGKHFRYIAVHEISLSLGPLKSVGLRMFYAFTGCDTV